MHELSLALEVCRVARQRLDAGGAGQVVTVAVEVGRDAGIEIENFRFCLESLLLEPPFNGARPDLTLRDGDDLRLAFLEVDDGR